MKCMEGLVFTASVTINDSGYAFDIILCCLYYVYVYSYHHSRILLEMTYIFSIWDSCHNITIAEDKLSGVFCPKFFIVLLIVKLFT